MPENLKKIALGGGCHWCTEAVFQALKGVTTVEQGYVSSNAAVESFSEAVIVHFKPSNISLERLIEVHLYTHRSTSNHSMRDKYRSAVYTFSELQYEEATNALEKIQEDFDSKIITQVYPFRSFKASREELRGYYLKDPEKPFCKTFIAPKLKVLLEKFSENLHQEP